MVAFIHCTACSTGDCDNHMRGETIPGLLGGWSCPCSHSKEERERNKAAFDERLAKMFGRKP